MSSTYALLPVVNSDEVIIIDAPLHAILKRYSWCIPKGIDAGNPGPFTRVKENGKERQWALARVVTKAPYGLYPKHLNGNFLDCRRANIELVDIKDEAGKSAPNKKR